MTKFAGYKEKKEHIKRHSPFIKSYKRNPAVLLLFWALKVFIITSANEELNKYARIKLLLGSELQHASCTPGVKMSVIIFS